MNLNKLLGASGKAVVLATDHRYFGVDDLVTHRFTLDQIGEAFDLATNPRDLSLKVLAEPHRTSLDS